MKKGIHLICALLPALVLFSGCNADSDPAEVLKTATQNGIYFATGNDYYDLYVGYSWIPGPEITLLSRTYIDPESITVTADIQAEYSVHVTQQERDVSLTGYEITENNGVREVTVTDAHADDFPLYLYQTYAGIDWAEVGSLYREYYAVVERYEAGEADMDQVSAALAAYDNATTEYITDYMALTEENIPAFYEYLIQLTVDSADREELLTSVQITVGETVYDVDVGQIYIHPGPEYGDGSEYLSTVTSSPLGVICYPYGKGIEQCQTETWYAEEALALTGLAFLEDTQSTVTVLDMTVVLAEDVDSARSGNGLEIAWDGTSEIYVEQGKYVTVFMTIQDDRMKEINYHSKLYPVVEFDCGGVSHEIISEIPLYRYYSDKWLLCAMGLDGLDMESYFEDYYYTAVSSWRSQES